MQRLGLVLAAIAAVVTLFASGRTQAGSLFTDYNLIVLDDLKTNGQEVEGRTLIGGDLKVSNWTVFGARLTSMTDAEAGRSLIVGNDLNGNLHLERGYLQYGNSLSTMLQSGRIMNAGTVPIQESYDFTPVEAQIKSLSTTYANMGPAVPGWGFTITENKLVTIKPEQLGGVAVVNLPEWVIDLPNLEFKFELGDVDALVVNVEGKKIEGWGNSQGTPPAEKILWNFYEAESLYLDRQVFGSVLAPHADAKNTTSIEGMVYVKSMNLNGEIHLVPFVGEPPKTVPTPGAAGAGLVMLLGLVQRRRKAAPATAVA